MQFPVNLVLEIRTQEEYDCVQEALRLLKCETIEDLDPTILDQLQDRVVVKLADATKESRVRINGYPVAFGTNEEMLQRYETECGMHLRSNVTLEEWRDGNYKSIKSRRLQKM